MKIPFSRTINQLIMGTYRTTQLKQSGWHFSKYRANMYALEYNDWLKHYLPTTGVNGKTILDIGAGEGETAKFYLDHGAIEIIAIEPDKNAYKLLEENAYKHPKRRIIPLNKPFELYDIERYSLIADLIKIDIEGYEEELLEHPHPKTPIICEVHGLQLADKFKKAGYHVITLSKYGCLSYAYWKCKPNVH